MPQLTDIAHYLNTYLQTYQYPQEKSGIWRLASKEITRIGLTLEPWPQIGKWVKESDLDALFIHRPWQLVLSQLPSEVGIISYHLPFDEKLTLGYNPMLALHLGMTAIEPLGEKHGRPLGMTGYIPTSSLNALRRTIEQLFGPLESIHAGQAYEITQIAVMGAMNENLILEVAQKGVQAYITGQFRKQAAKAVEKTGLHILAAGHQQSEWYGLQLLAELLQQKWPCLTTCIASR